MGTLRALAWSGRAGFRRHDQWLEHLRLYPDGIGPYLASALKEIRGVQATGVHGFGVDRESELEALATWTGDAKRFTYVDGHQLGLNPPRARLETAFPDAGEIGELNRLDRYQVFVAWAHGGPPPAWDAAVGELVRAGRLGLVALHSVWNHHAYPQIADLIGAVSGIGQVREGIPIDVEVLCEHPVTDRVGDFTIRDEIYFEPLEIASDVTHLLRGRWQEHASPFGWAREVGAGRVVYLQPGHEDCPVYAAARGAPPARQRGPLGRPTVSGEPHSKSDRQPMIRTRPFGRADVQDPGDRSGLLQPDRRPGGGPRHRACHPAARLRAGGALLRHGADVRRRRVRRAARPGLRPP